MEDKKEACCSTSGKCGNGRCCCKCCGKLVHMAGAGLMLWGIGYGINGFIHMFAWWGAFSAWYLIKYVLFRLGLTFAAILFAGQVMGCNKGKCCCPGGCCSKGECKDGEKSAEGKGHGGGCC